LFGGSASANGVLVSDALVALGGVPVHIVSAKCCSCRIKCDTNGVSALPGSPLLWCEAGVHRFVVLTENTIERASEGA
jgi:hypothetical protein